MEVLSPLTDRSGLSDFPVELFQKVLACAFGSYFHQRTNFIAVRGIAMLVCRAWRNFIVSSAEFWVQYEVRPNRPLVHFSLLETRFGCHLTDFRVHLGLDGATSVDRSSMEDCISFIAHHSMRTRALCIESCNHIGLPLVASSLLLADAPHLHTLEFAYAPRTISTRPRRPFPPLFRSGTGVPSLRVLRFDNFVLSWTHLTIYAHLTILVFSNLERTLAPTVHQLRAVLLAAANLVKLSLRDLHCPSFSGDVHPVVLLHVTDLDICYRGDRGIAALVSACHFPSIESLNVTFKSPSDVQSLLDSHQMLSTITRFHASGLVSSSEKAAEIFANLQSVVHMDLFDAGGDLFEALNISVEKHSPSVCPHLKKLSLSNVPLRELYAFVQRRDTRGPRPESLSVHYDEAVPLSGFFFDWLHANMCTFSVDPNIEWNAQWAYIDMRLA
ncbi:hypothetical protein DFH06DRAFT_1138604 [Mycena polygramma]|nr:hypothetical protein DFH06DRAFT_1138604 [Mycena polygramma]